MSLLLAAVPLLQTPCRSVLRHHKHRVTTEHSVVLHTAFVVVKEQCGEAHAGHRQLQSAPPTEARTVQPPSRHHAAADLRVGRVGATRKPRSRRGGGACVFWGTQVLMRI